MFEGACRSRWVIALALPLALAAGGCGGDVSSVATEDGGPTTAPESSPSTAAGGPGSTATPAPASEAASDDQAATVPQAQPDVPAVDVVVLADGSTVDLRSLAVPGRPTLLWFWAPHCSFCLGEATDLLEFAGEHGADVDVLGVGAQDSLGEAHGFVEKTGTAGLMMVWDPSGKSWVHYGVTNQPTVIVLGADGQVAGTWFRDFAPDEILAAAGVA